MKHLVIIIATTLSMYCTNAAGESPFKITTKRDNDKVEITVEKGKAVVSVRSPFGISQAIIKPKHQKWPETVMLQMHLKGLENFKVANGTVMLESAVSSQDGKFRQWKDGKEEESLDAKSPYWMKIRMVGHNGKTVKTIPLVDGYFEMQLPKALLEVSPKSITISWIDFYR